MYTRSLLAKEAMPVPQRNPARSHRAVLWVAAKLTPPGEESQISVLDIAKKVLMSVKDGYSPGRTIPDTIRDVSGIPDP
mgnify:CR=1 FL=1